MLGTVAPRGPAFGFSACPTRLFDQVLNSGNSPTDSSYFKDLPAWPCDTPLRVDGPRHSDDCLRRRLKAQNRPDLQGASDSTGIHLGRLWRSCPLSALKRNPRRCSFAHFSGRGNQTSHHRWRMKCWRQDISKAFRWPARFCRKSRRRKTAVNSLTRSSVHLGLSSSRDYGIEGRQGNTIGGPCSAAPSGAPAFRKRGA